jgi:hypothetical protein
MSDFSELCPLFETGVFNEICFPGPMGISSVGTLKDLLHGTVYVSCANGAFSFGRTVIVTEAFLARLVTNTIETTIQLRHKTSATLALSGTIFASCTLPISGSAHQPGLYKAFTSFTGKTFASSDILAMMAVSTGVDTGQLGGLIVKYKEA